MTNIARTFFALWYLSGWIVHVVLGTNAPEIYQPFGRTALFPSLRSLWEVLVMPRITIFALLLAAFELVTGVLILSKGVWVRIGLLGSIAFNVFLVVLGLGWSGSSAAASFFVNRLPNLLFATAQIPLLWVHFDRSILSVIGERLGSTGVLRPGGMRRSGMRGIRCHSQCNIRSNP